VIKLLLINSVHHLEVVLLLAVKIHNVIKHPQINSAKSQLEHVLLVLMILNVIKLQQINSVAQVDHVLNAKITIVVD